MNERIKNDNDSPAITRLAIAVRLREARELAGLSQGQVAKMMSMHRPTISEVEAGRRRVSAEELAKLAGLYGVSTAWLTGEGPDLLKQDEAKIQLAARQLGKLKSDDLDKVLRLLASVHQPERRGE